MPWYLMDHNSQMEEPRGLEQQGSRLRFKESLAGIQSWELVVKYRGNHQTGYDTGMNIK